MMSPPPTSASDGSTQANIRLGALTASDISKAAAIGRSKRKGHTTDSSRHDINNALARRSGAVLDNRCILKSDHVPMTMSDMFPLKITGAYNFRQSPATQIFGSGQATISGIRGILNILGASPLQRMYGESEMSLTRSKSVLWINLREEPTVFLNGRSFVLRNRVEPFHNLAEFQGIQRNRIQDLERRLKQDILEEAHMYAGSVVTHDEKNRKEIDASWEAVDVDNLMTPEEVFFTFSMKGYRVYYERVPTTPEQAPLPNFFDLLVDCLMRAPSDATIVFNCQTGYGRSTMAMVAAGLVQYWRGLTRIPHHASEFSRSRSDDSVDIDENDVFDQSSSFPSSPAPPTGISPMRSMSGMYLSDLEENTASNHVEHNVKDDATRQLEAGYYQPVISLMRVIENGKQSKKHVDFFCNDASALVNLRSVIMSQRGRASRERYEPAERYKLTRAATSLKRYMLLIAFDSYLGNMVKLFLDERETGNQKHQESLLPESFESWLTNRAEIVRLLQDVERRPHKALETVKAEQVLLTGTPGPQQHEFRKALESRYGSVLSTDTLLKADHFPGGFTTQNKQSTSSIRGASNYRNIEGTRVHGVCTPSVDAISKIVHYIQTAFNAKRVCWTNLREEAVVYINKQPFVLRSVKQPFRNVTDFASVSTSRLEAAEVRLKADILAEAKRLGGRVLVHTESINGTLELHWEQIQDEDDVLTPSEVYAQLVEANLPVSYLRLPMTPEQPPSADDIDAILKRVREGSDESGIHYVFNCQMGRGRTTMAMIMACMELEHEEFVHQDMSEHIFDNYKPAIPLVVRTAARSTDLAPADIASDSDDDEPAELMVSVIGERNLMRRESAETVENDGDDHSSHADDHSVVAEMSDFSSILSLVRVLSNGILAKTWANALIEKCGEVENIRKNIANCIEKALQARTIDRSSAFVARGLLNLRRYFYLVIVAAYELRDRSNEDSSFIAWFEERPELMTIYNEITSKLALQYVSDKVLAAPPNEENGEPHGDEVHTAGTDMSSRVFVSKRRGMVLTRGSVLKSDHFPGCNRLKNPKVAFTGAPNFRKLSVVHESVRLPTGFRDIGIYGTGIPTVTGLQELLRYIQSDSAAGANTKIVWINLREEPIIYINGRPMVLRKLEHPFENLEYTGISRERVEDMEDRLKVDVINEIMENDGKMLVHDEDSSGLQPVWETVDITEGSTAVQTPRDLYAMLSQQFRVVHNRVPITDEQAPKIRDCEQIAEIVRNTPLDAKIVFNCQMGRGRTTTGLVLGVAVRLWKRNDIYSFPKIVESLIAVDPDAFRTNVRGFRKSNPGKATYLDGNYKVINSLTRVLERGVEAKTITDAIVDFCDAMQNLREAIMDLKVVAEAEDKPAIQRGGARERGTEYVKRYFQLVEFIAYLMTTNPRDGTTTLNISSFSRWISSRSELKTVLRGASMD